MREMRGEVGENTPKKEMDTYGVTRLRHFVQLLKKVYYTYDCVKTKNYNK